MTGRFDNDSVKRAKGARAAAAARLAEFNGVLAALNGAKPDPANFEAALAHQERVAAHEVRVRLAREALTAAETALVAAISDAAEREARTRHAKVAKEAEDAEPLIRSIEHVSRILVKRLAALQSTKDGVAATNAELGARFGRIDDPEDRVRRQPGRVIAAVVGEQIEWQLGDGSRATFYHRDKSGELVASDAGARRVTKLVELSPERVDQPKTPASYVTTELFALDGSQLWPPK
jgi:hypothetical protein